MSQQNQCDNCLYNIYYDEYQSNICQMNLDEDEMARFSLSKSFSCPYFRFGDEYSIVRKQI